jgi:NADPH2:quinone reductase
MANDVFAMLANGTLKVDDIQRYALKDAAKAHVELSARRTTGSTILIP